MRRFVFGAVAVAFWLAPLPASAQVILPRRVTVVSYYPAPAPIVTTAYPVPAPVVTYSVAPAPAPILIASPYAAPVPVVTSYSYRVPLLRPVRIIARPVIIYGP